MPILGVMPMPKPNTHGAAWTPLEMECLRQWDAAGWQAKDIAAGLDRSLSSVQNMVLKRIRPQDIDPASFLPPSGCEADPTEDSPHGKAGVRRVEVYEVAIGKTRDEAIEELLERFTLVQIEKALKELQEPWMGIQPSLNIEDGKYVQVGDVAGGKVKQRQGMRIRQMPGKSRKWKKPVAA